MDFPGWAEIECAAAAGGIPESSRRRIREFYFRCAASAELRSLLSSTTEELFSGCRFTGRAAAAVFPRVAERDALYLLALLGGYERATETWRRRGFPAELFAGAWQDAGLWTLHHEENFGTTGLIPRIPAWMQLHLSAKIVRLGRLEFEFGGVFDFGVSIVRDRKGSVGLCCGAAPKGEVLLADGDPVAQIHIPAGAPLTPEACRDSLRRFAEFSARYLADVPMRALVCESWLLDPQLAGLLPEQSNIIRFQHLGGKLFSLPAHADTVWRVFGDRGVREGLKDRSNFNSLQHGIADFLQQGGQFHYGLLWIPLEKQTSRSR